MGGSRLEGARQISARSLQISPLVRVPGGFAQNRHRKDTALPSAGRGMTQALAVDGGLLEFARWPGRGIPILLLHEGLGSVALWRDFPSMLAQATEREVVAWSRRGHGQSNRLPHPRDPDYMHREAEAVV